MKKKIGVVGAGTMGSGIALSAAQNDFDVVLFDSNAAVLENAKKSIEGNLQFLLTKQKISEAEKDVIYKRIIFTSSIEDCIADIIIEAIIENPDAKIDLFNKLAQINKSETIFASNTSSLSINELQKGILKPERFAGMHFFNPAHIMKLVEVVKGQQTGDAVIEALMELSTQLQKTPVLCKDAPGFIVNRVARHYYLEAMKLVENKIASFEDVDEMMEASGFKMGPFKLMDLIGMDINLAVSESIYHAFDKNKRFQPSILQIEKVKNGQLGRKTGKGFYEYK